MIMESIHTMFVSFGIGVAFAVLVNGVAWFMRWRKGLEF